MTTNSVYNRKSRLVQGGTTDRYAKRLGWWERKTFERSDTDIRVTIQPREEFRPDLVAYRIYEDPQLAWMVLQYNSIIDIQTEFVVGAELILPSPRRVQLDVLTQTTGGNRV